MAIGYGFYPGGDPRRFVPDEEINTPEELENHRLACEAWDKGATELYAAGCVVLPDGSIRNISGFGLGTYEFEEEDDGE